MNVKLTPRDIEIFKFIFNNDYVTTSQIRRSVFPDKSRTTAKVRVYQLVAGGYLERINSGFIQTVFKLKRAALDELCLPKEEIARYERKKLLTEQLAHDLKITDCRTIFEASPIVRVWTPAHKLRQYAYMAYQFRDNRRTKVPDALFDLIVKGTPLKAAFEFENTPKKKSRYFHIIEKYLTLIPVDLALYVVKPIYLKDTILKIGKEKMRELVERGIAVKNKLYLATMDDFEKQRLDTTFEGINGKQFSIKALEQKV